jgi:quaternary ammonium compound-resistance protein SugE
MAWVILVLAGLLEIGWAVGLKYSGGLTRPWPTAATIATMVAGIAGLKMVS